MHLLRTPATAPTPAVTMLYGVLAGVVLDLDLRARKGRLELDTLETDLQTSAAFLEPGG